MPAPRKPATRTTTTARKRTTAAEPPALKRLNKSLDDAQKALVALRKDVGKDVSQGARELYSDLGKFIKDARRHSGKLSTALGKDLEALQKRLAESGKAATGKRRTGSRSTTAKRTPSGRTAAKRG
jgi:uncharacterized membrane-anchored protein YhcB (DUF1043 family)